MRNIDFEKEYALKNVPFVWSAKRASDAYSGNPIDRFEAAIQKTKHQAAEHVRQVVSAGRPASVTHVPVKENGFYQMKPAVTYHTDEHLPDPGAEASAATDIEYNARQGAEGHDPELQKALSKRGR